MKPPKNYLIAAVGFVIIVTGLLVVVQGQFRGISPDNLSIEFDMMSGMPNPVCKLTTDQAKKILSSIQTTPLVFHARPKDYLGYRGLVLTSEDGTVHLTFSDGHIFDAHAPFIRLDAGQEIEKDIAKQVSTPCLNQLVNEAVTQALDL